MPLMETVVVTIGTAIAKSMVKTWLKDPPVAQEIGLSLVDLFSKKSTDILAQRRAARQFEEIGEKVAESFLPLFQGAALKENEKEAVALAVAGTLNSGGLDARLIAQLNFDPHRIAEHLMEADRKATVGFSETESELYRRVVEKSIAAIVDISSKLPSFTERSLGEILMREDQLLSIAVDSLSRIREIQEISQIQNPTGGAALFEEEYRQAIIRNLDWVELFGMDVPRASRRHSLSVAYISLWITPRAARHRPSLVGQAAQGRLSVSPTGPSALIGDTGAEAVPATAGSQSVEEVLSSNQRLLIRGMAGSGKTTLLKWIAVNAARGTLAGALAAKNTHVPFFIPLRAYLQLDALPTPDEDKFARFVVQTTAHVRPTGWVRECLRSSRAIVLIDGVDEMPLTKRENVRRWLADLTSAFQTTQFIVSSRPSAIEEGWLDPVGFADTELREMTIPDIHVFIDHWHEAVRQELYDDAEKEELDLLAGKLKRDVESTPALLRLATSPLLCAALCALNRRRDVPANRVQLYEKLSAMLLELREKGQDLLVEGVDYPRLSYEQKRVLLNDLAYWMLRSDQLRVSFGQAEQHLQGRIQSMGGITASATAVRRLFVERSGMIREPVPDYLDFAHRTFLEYLAAQAVLDSDDVEFMLNNASDDKWREVIILAAGLAKKRDCENIFRGLLKRADESTASWFPVLRRVGSSNSSRHNQLSLLAVACLENVVDLQPEIRDTVEQRLSTLIPPKNMEDAGSIAAAGELAVRHLHYRAQWDEAAAAACVRALTLIGTDNALVALGGYATDQRQEVIEEVDKARESFDQEKYFRVVLAQRSPRSLKVTRMSTLAGIEHLRSLTDLRVANAKSVTDLTPLAELSNLTTLDLSEAESVTDLTPLAGLSNLTTLILYHAMSVTDLTPLAGLSNLTTLELTLAMRLADLTPLAGLSNLITLDLSYVGSLAHLTPLANRSNLTALAGLSNLTTLGLSYDERQPDLTPLSKLPNLTTLTLSSARSLTDLTPLASLSNLTTLTLFEAESLTDLTPLASLSNLTELGLFGAKRLTDLTPLAGLSNLTELILTEATGVRDLSPIKGRVRLTVVNEQSLVARLSEKLIPKFGR